MAKVTDDEVWETWDSVLLKTTTLGHRIADAARENKTPIDKVVVVPRGGLFISNIIGRQLGLSGDGFISLGLSKYDRKQVAKTGKFKMGQMPTRKEVEGYTLVIADEVNDSGETTKYAKDYLLKLGAKHVYTAAVHYKPGKNITGETPDFYIHATNGWVHYPWEVTDMIGSLHQDSMN